ncbi:hypothetical protein OS493_039531 [Desmophyllum pertusum]|uniref:Uncharacterized protein n=1 Tax=Desmophyllum pertusum TaxID=174260 RepID=A0A9X0CZY5_9CNID|nr:hypothetical protein OS493_039531 [Desmophyllum pertusum]
MGLYDAIKNKNTMGMVNSVLGIVGSVVALSFVLCHLDNRPAGIPTESKFCGNTINVNTVCLSDSILNSSEKIPQRSWSDWLETTSGTSRLTQGRYLSIMMWILINGAPKTKV